MRCVRGMLLRWGAGPVSNDETRTLVRDLYAAYAAGDDARVAAMIDDDVEWIIYGPVQVFSFVGARRGKAAVLETLAGIAHDYALERYQPDIIVVEGERAAVMSNVAFVQRSTGRTLSFRNANSCASATGAWSNFASSPTPSTWWSRRSAAGSSRSRAARRGLGRR